MSAFSNYLENQIASWLTGTATTEINQTVTFT